MVNNKMKDFDREFMLRHSVRKLGEYITNNVENNNRPSRYRTIRLLVNRRSFLMEELVKIEREKNLALVLK